MLATHHNILSLPIGITRLARLQYELLDLAEIRARLPASNIFTPRWCIKKYRMQTELHNGASVNTAELG